MVTLYFFLFICGRAKCLSCEHCVGSSARVNVVYSSWPTEVSRKVTSSFVQDDTKKWELLKNPTKIEEIQEKNSLTEIEPLQIAF